MSTADKALASIAAVLFLGAGLANHHAQRVIHQYRWTVLEQPIRFEDGFAASYPFKVDLAATYWLEVVCRKTIPFQTLDQTLSTKLAAEYSITSGTERIASGDTALKLGMSGTNDSLGRLIATFDATPGTPYTLALHITAPLPELASTRPTVEIEVDPLVYKEAYVSASLFVYLALSLAVPGLLCSLPVIWRLLFRRQRPIVSHASGQMEIAGRTCTICQRHVTFTADAKFCPHCGVVVHELCEPGDLCSGCGRAFLKAERLIADPAQDALLPPALRPWSPGQAFVALALAVAAILAAVYYALVFAMDR